MQIDTFSLSTSMIRITLEENLCLAKMYFSFTHTSKYFSVAIGFLLLLHLILLVIVISEKLSDSKCSVTPVTGEQLPLQLPLNCGNTNVSHDEWLSSLQFDSQLLIDFIRIYMLEKPSSEPYSLEKPDQIHYSQHGQSQFWTEYFKNKTGGTFFEAGAYTGELISNSLYFEKSLNWTGVLVEPNIYNQQQIRSKKRKCHFLPGCVSGLKTPSRIRFTCPYGLTGINTWGCQLLKDANFSVAPPENAFDSWCFPIYSILKAAGIDQLDYMSVDLEGFELESIRHFPFDKLQVKVVQMEVFQFSEADGIRNETQRFFATNWPHLYEEIKFPKGQLDLDVGFVHKTI